MYVFCNQMCHFKNQDSLLFLYSCNWVQYTVSNDKLSTTLCIKGKKCLRVSLKLVDKLQKSNLEQIYIFIRLVINILMFTLSKLLINRPKITISENTGCIALPNFVYK